jgi:hypothetical protein
MSKQRPRTLELYPFSLQGSVAEQYGHFFFSVLVPFAVLEHTAPASTKFVFKLDIGGFVRILASLWPDRDIKVEPVERAGRTSCIVDNFDLYVETARRAKRSDTEMLLDSTEVFDDIVFQYVMPDSRMNARRLDALQERYFEYYYTKDKVHKLTYQENAERKRLYLTKMHRQLAKARPTILAFFARLAAERPLPPPVQKNRGSVVLISRPIVYKFETSIFAAVGGQRRFIWNFDALRRSLENEFGSVKTVVLENMDIMEQYDVFRKAKVVVGQHGAGLVNAFFMRPGTHVVEIAPVYNDRNNFFKNMAHFCDLKYTAVAQPGMTPEQARDFFAQCEMPDAMRDAVALSLAAYYNGEIDMTVPWAVPNEVNLAANSGEIDVDTVVYETFNALHPR